MKAVVYHGPGEKAWGGGPRPELIDPTDVIAVGGHDHDLRDRPAHPQGGLPAVTDGWFLLAPRGRDDHQVGQAVSKLAVGDRVIISCITGSCSYCHQQLPAHRLDDEGTSGIGWIFGHLINGTQAEYVRVPFAEQLLCTPARGCERRGRGSCSLTAMGFEIGVRSGRVEPGDVVADRWSRRRCINRRTRRRLPHHRHRPRRQPGRAGQGLRRH